MQTTLDLNTTAMSLNITQVGLHFPIYNRLYMCTTTSLTVYQKTEAISLAQYLGLPDPHSHENFASFLCERQLCYLGSYRG